MTKEEIEPLDLLADKLESAADNVTCKSLLCGKKRQVYKFYRRQTNLLEKFRNDSQKIQVGYF